MSSAINLCTLIYMGVGIAGYLAFADTQFTGIIISQGFFGTINVMNEISVY